MKTSLATILILTSISTINEAKNEGLVRPPNTYKECIQRASDINSKWIKYQVDVNKCRTQFGVPGEY